MSWLGFGFPCSLHLNIASNMPETDGLILSVLDCSRREVGASRFSSHSQPVCSLELHTATTTGKNGADGISQFFVLIEGRLSPLTSLAVLLKVSLHSLCDLSESSGLLNWVMRSPGALGSPGSPSSPGSSCSSSFLRFSLISSSLSRISPTVRRGYVRPRGASWDALDSSRPRSPMAFWEGLETVSSSVMVRTSRGTQIDSFPIDTRVGNYITVRHKAAFDKGILC